MRVHDGKAGPSQEAKIRAGHDGAVTAAFWSYGCFHPDVVAEPICILHKGGKLPKTFFPQVQGPSTSCPVPSAIVPLNHPTYCCISCSSLQSTHFKSQEDPSDMPPSHHDEQPTIERPIDHSTHQSSFPLNDQATLHPIDSGLDTLFN